MDIQKGYLFISDISGYTQFLMQSELDHAKEILDALFDSILHHLNPPNYITSQNTNLALVVKYLFGFNFRPVEGGTMFTVLYGPPDMEITEETKALFQPYADNTAREFTQFVDEEIAAGRIRPEEFREIDGRKGEHLRPGVDQGRFAALRGKNV